MLDMTRTRAALSCASLLGVIATASPQATQAPLRIAVMAFELVFEHLPNAAKSLTQESHKIACVIDGTRTIRPIRGMPMPEGLELIASSAILWQVFPRSCPPVGGRITYIRVRPTWIRYSDFRDNDAVVVEFKGDELLDA